MFCILLQLWIRKLQTINNYHYLPCKKPFEETQPGEFMARSMKVCNRPGVAGAVQQTPLSLTHWVIDTCQSSKRYKSQTVKARELKFWEKVCLPPRVMCHMSCVTCHMSRVTCHMQQVSSNLFKHKINNKGAKLVGGGSVINGAYPVYLYCIWSS